MNQTILSGKIVKDATIITASNGNKLLSLNLANNDRDYKDKSSGEWINQPDYYIVKKWYKPDANIETFVSKLVMNTTVIVMGRSTSEAYMSKEGKPLSNTVIEDANIEIVK